MAIFYYICTTRETLIWLENVKSHICNFLSASLILLVLSNLTTNPLNDITKIPQNYTYFPFLLLKRELVFVIAHYLWSIYLSQEHFFGFVLHGLELGFEGEDLLMPLLTQPDKVAALLLGGRHLRLEAVDLGLSFAQRLRQGKLLSLQQENN